MSPQGPKNSRPGPPPFLGSGSSAALSHVPVPHLAARRLISTCILTVSSLRGLFTALEQPLMHTQKTVIQFSCLSPNAARCVLASVPRGAHEGRAGQGSYRRGRAGTGAQSARSADWLVSRFSGLLPPDQPHRDQSLEEQIRGTSTSLGKSPYPEKDESSGAPLPSLGNPAGPRQAPCQGSPGASVGTGQGCGHRTVPHPH